MSALVDLSNETLARMPEGIRVPRYNRSKLTPGIVHIGLGNFHRAHQSWYLHRLMDLGEAHDWAIIGAGVRAPDAAQRDRLISQDCLTTLIELSPDSSGVEIVGSMIDFLPVEDHNGPLVAKMAKPEIRIVSLTVTEGGYYRKGDGAFDIDHPDIQHDAASPEKPRTAFGAMVAALRRRRDAGVGPFTGLSCDNLQGNGAILQNTLVSLARLSDPDLAAWIETNCTFPNSMVDCIVPATGPNEIALARSIGIDDAAPVTHEDFRQWVIEDNFCAGRPDWNKVGATFSTQVHDYEAMKLRILNAGHQLLANVGEILSIETISGCMTHPAIADFFRKVQMEEIVPQVGAVPGMSPVDYVDLIERRFANPKIVDTTRRVAFDGSSRHAGFLLPMVRERLSSGDSIEGLALAEALWARMCTGKRDDGSKVEPNDPQWSELVAVAEASRSNPDAWLAQRNVYGDLAESETFAAAFSMWLSMLHDIGAEATLRRFAPARAETLSSAEG